MSAILNWTQHLFDEIRKDFGYCSVSIFSPDLRSSGSEEEESEGYVRNKGKVGEGDLLKG